MMNKIDWRNPLGFTSKIPDYESPNFPCSDLNHFFAWIFWRANVVQDLGGSIEDVRSVRHMLLSCVEKKDYEHPTYKMEKNDVLVSSFNFHDILSLVLDISNVDDESKDLRFSYCLDMKVWDKKHIATAIELNLELKENPPLISTHWEPTILTTTRIVPQGSEAYRDCMKIIQKSKSTESIDALRELFKENGPAGFVDNKEFTAVLSVASHVCRTIWSKRK